MPIHALHVQCTVRVHVASYTVKSTLVTVTQYIE